MTQENSTNNDENLLQSVYIYRQGRRQFIGLNMVDFAYRNDLYVPL